MMHKIYYHMNIVSCFLVWKTLMLIAHLFNIGCNHLFSAFIDKALWICLFRLKAKVLQKIFHNLAADLYFCWLSVKFNYMAWLRFAFKIHKSELRLRTRLTVSSFNASLQTLVTFKKKCFFMKGHPCMSLHI